MELQGACAIVTGGASGLGSAVATRLAWSGADVAIFDLDEEKGRDHAKHIGGSFYQVDVTDEDSVRDAMESVRLDLGVARVLVNSTSIAPRAKTVADDGTPHQLDVLRKTIELNLLGSFNVLSKFASILATVEPICGERGVIINTASQSAFDGRSGQSASAASNGGLVSMTLPVSRDLAPLGIRVMTLALGAVRARPTKNYIAADLEGSAPRIRHRGCPGTPEEFAHMVEAIIRNPMLNGEVIRMGTAVKTETVSI